MSEQNVWVTRGFDAFRQGSCGNAGQNLYVSRAGVLQRIHQYDLNGDGYFDLLFCNSQNHAERPPTYVYPNPLQSMTFYELPAEGAWTGTVADLNGDGFDDLVIGMWYNGIRHDLNAVIYYGAPDGLSERRQQQLPAPRCSAVAAGDFNGDGKVDLAFLCHGRLRLFYQSTLGFEPLRYVDVAINGEQLAAADLDGDGYTDLVVRHADGRVQVYWGSAAGFDPAQVTAVTQGQAPREGEIDQQAHYVEFVEDATPLACIVWLHGLPYLFAPQPEQAQLIPVMPNRTVGAPLLFQCRQAMAVAVGDVKDNGQADLVFACRETGPKGECSWVYWGAQGNDLGYSEGRRTPLPSGRACDVAVADLDGDGCAEILLCQNRTEASYTNNSLLYRSTPFGVTPEPLQLLGHDARRVLVARPSAGGQPQVILINHFGRNALGNINPYLYWGGPNGFAPERRQELPGWGAVEALCCDLNDDGQVDIVLANASENSVAHDPGSYILLGGPTGFPAAPTWTVPTTRAHGVCCADLNRDGYLDLLFCGFNNPELLIFYGTATGLDTANPTRIRLEYEGIVYREPRWIYLADLNNDGWLDLVVPQIADDRSFILWGGPDGFSMTRCQALSVIRGACARAADLTGNGYLDLIVGGHTPAWDGPHDSFVYIYWNGPEGLHEDRRTLLPASTINAMSVADFNNDGLLDLFICSYHGGRERDIDSYIYWQRAGRGFAAADRTRLFTHSASGCVAADFNEDGWIDLAIAYHKVWGDHAGHSAVWWNGADGFVEGRVTSLPTLGPHGMTAVEPGNLMDRGPIEYYISGLFILPAGSQVTQIGWEATLPSKTWVQAQLRFAATEQRLAQSPWLGPVGEGSWYENGQNVTAVGAGPWVQYRLALGARDSCGTPRVTEVRVSYR